MTQHPTMTLLPLPSDHSRSPAGEVLAFLSQVFKNRDLTSSPHWTVPVP